MTAKASSMIASPPVVCGEFGNSPPQQAEKRNNLPWARVVKGGEADEAMSLPPPPEPSKEQSISSDCSSSNNNFTENHVAALNNGNVGSPKKTVWNKPLNELVAPSPPVIAGATSWPALSKSARLASKSMLDSSKPPPPPVENQSVSTSKEPVISHAPRRQANTNRNFNSASPNNTAIDNHHQRPSRHNMNHGVRNAANNGFDWQRAPPPPPPQSPSHQLPYYGVPNYPRPYGFPMVDSSVREPFYNGHSWDGGRPVGGGLVPNPKPHAQVDQSSQRNSSRKGNGSHIDGNQVRYDSDRNRIAAQSSNVRDGHGNRQPVPYRGFPPPPPPPMSALPFPQPMSPYGPPLGFASPILYYPPPVEHYIYTPFIGHAPPPLPSQMQMYITPSVDPSVKESLIYQIHYYFSNANLDKDKYLKSYMDDQGWVPLSLIAGFPKVKALTQEINVILNSLRDSTVVEIQGDKIRRRDDWMNWIIPRSGQVNSGTDSDSKLPAVSVDNTITTSDQNTITSD
ncbi:la-related protein 1B-like [Impatiens glandulifera]|uniref:la-related protein 1B-like n=1 Tax=Impatiens glandulifera TaxID=253017 RepID=UPI001FB156A1|nr:la-related protein 1B-like [Impatiens glandulifera]